jgi:hypothetical protein
VTLEVTHEGRGKDPWGGGAHRLCRDRQDQAVRFRVDVERGARNGGFLVGDDVKISLDVEAVKA